MTELPERISLPTTLLQNIVEYLSQRPYREVAQILGAIQTDHLPVVVSDVVEKTSARKTS